jgi:hypothetical protein
VRLLLRVCDPIAGVFWYVGSDLKIILAFELVDASAGVVNLRETRR